METVHRQKGYLGSATVVPLGFDPQMYSPTQDVSIRHRNSSGTFRLAFVGRVVEEKGLITLSRALGKIRDLDWQLIMIGTGPHEEAVKRELQFNGVSGRVEWRGFVPHEQVARFFESVDCLVLPSESRPNWTEQFGRVLVESMACGTPVIGSDSGEIPNIIRQTKGGLIFREADPDSCANALRMMISDSRQRAEMAEAGKTYVHENYALPVLADRFADSIEAAAR